MARSPSRPSAKLATLMPCFPRTVPTWPMTPGRSLLRMTIIVPSSPASTPMPSSVTSRGKAPRNTVPSAHSSPDDVRSFTDIRLV
jgi:hypothetical protein